MAHYYTKHFQERLITLCRDGLTSRPYRTVSTNHAFVGAVPRPPLQIDLQERLVIEPSLQINLQGRLVLQTAPTNLFVGAAQEPTAPTNLFVGAAVVPAASIIPVCRGGSIQNRPYSTFFRKKIQIYNSNSTRTLFVSAYSIQRSRYRTPRDQRSEPCSRCRMPRDQRSDHDYKHKSII